MRTDRGIDHDAARFGIGGDLAGVILLPLAGRFSRTR